MHVIHELHLSQGGALCSIRIEFLEKAPRDDSINAKLIILNVFSHFHICVEREDEHFMRTSSKRRRLGVLDTILIKKAPDTRLKNTWTLERRHILHQN